MAGLLVAILFVISSSASAESEEPARPTGTGAPADSARAQDEATRNARRFRLFPPRFYAWGVFYLPKLAYSDDRGFGVGGQAYYPFRWAGSDVTVPASSLSGRALFTLKGQVSSEVESVTNLGSLPWTLQLKVSYQDIAERFYGIGPDSPSEAKEIYRPQRLRAYLELSRPVFARLAVGARLEYENVLLRDLDPAGQLVQGELRGTNRQTVGGLGLLATWDARDDHAFPRHGTYAEAFYLPFSESLGGDYDFDNYNLDARAYFPMPGGHALATQLFYYAVRGEPPFWRYASLGGREHTRGYRKDRYLDRVLVAFQSEYRFHCMGRVSAAGFAGLADVASTVHHLQLEHMKPSVGGGLRVRVGPGRSSPTARLDVGFGGSSPRFYLDFGEAF